MYIILNRSIPKQLLINDVRSTILRLLQMRQRPNNYSINYVTTIPLLGFEGFKDGFCQQDWECEVRMLKSIAYPKTQQEHLQCIMWIVI